MGRLVIKSSKGLYNSPALPAWPYAGGSGSIATTGLSEHCFRSWLYRMCSLTVRSVAGAVRLPGISPSRKAAARKCKRAKGKSRALSRRRGRSALPPTRRLCSARYRSLSGSPRRTVTRAALARGVSALVTRNAGKVKADSQRAIAAHFRDHYHFKIVSCCADPAGSMPPWLSARRMRAETASMHLCLR